MNVSDKLMGALAHMATMDRTLEVLRVPNPAPGAQFQLTFPGDRVYRVRAVSAKLTASVAVANRQPALTLDDQSSVVASAVHGAVTVASGVTTYTWAVDYAAFPTVIVGGVASAPLPVLVFPGGYRLTSVAAGFDVADQWSAINVWVETLLAQPMGAHEYRDALELFERFITSPFLSGSES
jgi:hypothetical protein